MKELVLKKHEQVIHTLRAADDDCSNIWNKGENVSIHDHLSK